jgi:hypothetical protein
LGDSTKWFRHLKGVATILQKATNARQLCSTVIGRSLLEWYMQAENYYCSLASRKLLLPKAWREENVQIRQKLADQEYPRLSAENRKARILDDAWPQFWSIFPAINEVALEMQSLKTLSNDKRAQSAARLEEDLRQCFTKIEQFLASRHIMEVLQPVDSPSVSYRSKHEFCCPQLPLTPYHMQFPPAGIFRMVVYTNIWYIQSVLYPVVRAQFDSFRTTPFEKEISYYSHEICKTFAGLEEDFGDDPDAMIHLFPLLIVSTTNCAPKFREWLWFKLRHIERLGYLTFKSTIRHFAKLWNIPDIVTKGFSCSPPFQAARDISCEDIIAAAEEFKLEDEQSDIEVSAGNGGSEAFEG